jgi:hypothetical protein
MEGYHRWVVYVEDGLVEEFDEEDSWVKIKKVPIEEFIEKRK